MNGRSNDSTAINAKNNEIIATFPIGEKPENCAVDGAGKLYVNIENSSEVVEIDAAKPAVTRRASLAPCEGPSGLAIDVKNKKLFSVCSNKMMAVTDIATMKVIATPPIGAGADGAGFDSGLAFSSNGDGTMTIVKPVNGKYEAVDTVTTERGARTMTVDPTNHRIYMLAAEYGPAAGSQGRPKGAPPAGLARQLPRPRNWKVVALVVHESRERRRGRAAPLAGSAGAGCRLPVCVRTGGELRLPQFRRQRLRHE